MDGRCHGGGGGGGGDGEETGILSHSKERKCLIAISSRWLNAWCRLMIFVRQNEKPSCDGDNWLDEVEAE